jgi:phosphocarrier protein
MPRVTAQVTISNVMGIHLRPASSLVQMSNQYPDCEVEFTRNGLTVNGKSIMSVIMLGAKKGDTVTIKAEGKEARDLVDKLIALIESGFNEQE